MARDDDKAERREQRRRTARLDVPRSSRRNFVPRPTVDQETLGRLSERIARFLGTGTFLAWMTVVIVAWVVWNIWGPGNGRFDTYPFIFLTLVLSLQASYSAPLILLAQNRQEGRDRVNLEQDRDATARANADMEYLAREVAALRLAMGEVATRDYLRSELRSLLAELDDRSSGEPPSDVLDDDDVADPRRRDDAGQPRSLEP